MLGRKKKKPLFGGTIQPDCALCRNNLVKRGDGPRCALGLTIKNDKCKKFRYDPLRREPKTAPPLRQTGYSEEDFKL